MRRHLTTKIVLLAGLGAAITAFRTLSREEPVPQFADITRFSGIKFHHLNGDPKNKRYLFEAKGGGVASFDFDNDGWMDILLVQGSTLERFKEGKNPGPVLYKNLGNGHFVEVTQKAGLRETSGWGMGVAIGDYDNDGFADIYLTCLGPNDLYRNNRDGTFTDVTQKAGVGDRRWSTSAAFGDYDADGDLDLYVCNYVEMNFDRLPSPGSNQFCSYLGQPVLCGPRGILGAADALYRNNGDGTFTDVSHKSGAVDEQPLAGLGVAWADVDNDYDLDLYVANDAQHNLLFLNQGDGSFQERGLASGVALSGDAREQASMGVDIADYDNDGRMDIFLTHFAGDYSTLYHNEGNLVWEDVTIGAKLRKSYGVLVGWGTRFADFNHDGWKDIYHSNGHVYPFLAGADYPENYLQPGTFFLNHRDGTFLDVSTQVGAGLQTRKSSRGVAFADFDNDGDIDFVVSNMDDSPQLFRNDRSDSNHWIMFKTVGTRSNRDGIGARITVFAGKLEQIWEIKRTVGIYSASDPRAHFGLGKFEKVEQVKVRWRDGKIQEFKNLPADHHYVIVENEGIREEVFSKGK